MAVALLVPLQFATADLHYLPFGIPVGGKTYRFAVRTPGVIGGAGYTRASTLSRVGGDCSAAGARSAKYTGTVLASACSKVTTATTAAVSNAGSGCSAAGSYIATNTGSLVASVRSKSTNACSGVAVCLAHGRAQALQSGLSLVRSGGAKISSAISVIGAVRLPQGPVTVPSLTKSKRRDANARPRHTQLSSAADPDSARSYVYRTHAPWATRSVKLAICAYVIHYYAVHDVEW